VLIEIAHELNQQDIDGLECDYIALEWYEAAKKVLHKTSRGGSEVGIRNLAGRPLRDGDVLWRDESRALLVELLPCDCIVLKPQTMPEMARAGYELGNRHAPLFIEGEELLTPYDAPLFKALEKCGFAVARKTAKLKTPLGGYGDGHGNEHGHGHGHAHRHS